MFKQIGQTAIANGTKHVKDRYGEFVQNSWQIRQLQMLLLEMSSAHNDKNALPMGVFIVMMLLYMIVIHLKTNPHVGL
jgi:hypothetical protein